jgi:hypothetical protein
MSGECDKCGECEFYSEYDVECKCGKPSNNGWISVKDQLPSPFARVLLTDKTITFVGFLQKAESSKIWWVSNASADGEAPAPYLTYIQPTHWMPLPEPPND